MTQEQNFTSKTETPKSLQQAQTNSNRILIIAMIALAVIAVVFATLFFTSRATNNSAQNTDGTAKTQQQNTTQNGNGTSEKTAKSGTKAHQQKEAKQNSGATQEVSKEVKEAIEAQHRLDPNDPMAKGKVNAPVVIEAYVDFRCGHCAKYSLETEPQLEKRIKSGEIRYEFNSLPVLGPQSVLAAQAAQAAANQDMFWEFHDELFRLTGTSAKYDDATFTDIAKKVGVPDLARFETEMKSEETVNKVRAAAERAQKLGLNGTPAFLVGYTYIPGAVDISTLNQVIDQELNRGK